MRIHRHTKIATVVTEDLLTLILIENKLLRVVNQRTDKLKHVIRSSVRLIKAQNIRLAPSASEPTVFERSFPILEDKLSSQIIDFGASSNRDPLEWKLHNPCNMAKKLSLSIASFSDERRSFVQFHPRNGDFENQTGMIDILTQQSVVAGTWDFYLLFTFKVISPVDREEDFVRGLRVFNPNPCTNAVLSVIDRNLQFARVGNRIEAVRKVRGFKSGTLLKILGIVLRT